MKTIQYTAAGMIQGAVIQYRNYFKTMALGGKWCLYRAESGETLSGVILAPAGDCPELLTLVEDVQSMTEDTMRMRLDLAIRKHGATPDYTETDK